MSTRPAYLKPRRLSRYELENRLLIAIAVGSHLHDQIQAMVGVDEELPEGAVLKGWICIAEWMAPDGDCWLTRVSGGPALQDESKGLPVWQEQGYLYNALDGWQADDDDD